MDQLERVEPVPISSPSVPAWVRDLVPPSDGPGADTVQVLHGHGRKSAVVFAHDRTLVAEKPVLGRARLYEVYFPERFVIESAECPHCHHAIEAPFLRVRVTERTEDESKPATLPFIARRAGPSAALEGDNYPVLEVEGIGEVYAARLEEAGIRTTHDLLSAGRERVAEVAQAPLIVVDAWAAMAELMRVSGIGKQFAELLVRSGVRSIDQLRRERPKALLARLKATQASHKISIQGAELGERRVAGWIASGRSMKRRRSGR